MWPRSGGAVITCAGTSATRAGSGADVAGGASPPRQHPASIDAPSPELHHARIARRYQLEPILASSMAASYDRAMDRDAIRAWKRGHELAQERIREEERQASSADRVAQLLVLARTAEKLRWATTDPSEVDAVRARFAKLHAARGTRR
jgi:hypothetical protein